MKVYISERVLNSAEKFVFDKTATVRSIAKSTGVSKSTVHKDLTERLQEVNINLYADVQERLKLNTQERHIRGGQATREKYLSLSQIKGEGLNDFNEKSTADKIAALKGLKEELLSEPNEDMSMEAETPIIKR